MNPSLATKVENTYKDIDGRIIAIDVICNDVSFSICNVYAPTSHQLQGKFLQILNEFLTSNLNITQLIVGGDWNVTLENIDKRGGTQWKQTAYRNSVVSMMHNLDLIDIFRKLKPNTKSYSYESKFFKVKSRIDYFLIANNLTNLVQNVGTKTAITPDHKAIKLCLKPFKSTRGPGLWKFNNSLLKDAEYVNLISDKYPIIREKYADIADKRLKWEMIKMELRGVTISFAKHKAKNFNKQELDLQKRLDDVDSFINNCVDNQHIEEKLKEFDRLKNELNRLYETKARGAILRSKVKWVELGEKPNKYFFNMEKKNYNKKVIKELKRPDGKITVNDHEIMSDIETFYKNLYTSNVETNSDAFNGFIDNLSFAKLSNEDKMSLEGEITREECKNILKTFQNGKSPGEDGYTAEFYKQFFSLLGQDLTDSLNAAFESGEMSVSQRRGVITLIPKEDSDALLLSNWRPITLLNVDTSALCDSLSSVKNLIGIVDEFGKFSGLKLNTSKTKAIWLGPWRDREDEPFNLKWTKKPVRTLGIFVSYDENGNKERNFTINARNLNTSLDIWRSRYLTLFGRVLIIKSLGIPHLVYSSSMLETPPETISSVTTSLFDFIWRKKPDKIKRQVMYQDIIDGGLRVPNMEVMAKSLKLAWISRFLKADMLSRKENWKIIPDYFLRKHGGLNFLLRCNYDKKLINQIDIPAFYKQLLLYFLELKNLYGYSNGQEFILFNNKEIRIENKTIFLKSWFENEILTIQDILNENGKFLSFNEFKQNYNVNCNFLIYFQIINAIPKHLSEKAKNAQLNKNYFQSDGSNFNFQLSSSISIDLTKMKNKDYYWLFMKKSIQKITGTSKWERELSSNDIHWKDYFKQLKCICKENKLKEFYFKLVHRILVSKKELHLYGITANPNCTFCGQPDSIGHTFIECPNSKQFFNEVLQYFNQENVTSYSLSVEELLFGKLVDGRQPLLKKLNYSMLFAK